MMKIRFRRRPQSNPHAHCSLILNSGEGTTTELRGYSMDDCVEFFRVMQGTDASSVHFPLLDGEQ